MRFLPDSSLKKVMAAAGGGDYHWQLVKNENTLDADGVRNYSFHMARTTQVPISSLNGGAASTDDNSTVPIEETLLIGRPALGGKGGVYECIKTPGFVSSYTPKLQLWLRMNIRYRASDIVISTYPKCGTTLTEQVCL